LAVQKRWERELPGDRVEVGLALDVGDQLALVRLHALHQDRQLGNPSQEALVVVGVEVIAGLVEPLEAPAVHLARERLKLVLDEMLRDYVPD
jgi:hypothetical protein